MHSDKVILKYSCCRWRTTRSVKYRCCNLTEDTRIFIRLANFTPERERKSITMNITPYLRTPFTDFLSSMWTFQNHRECSRHELRVVDCMEAYGVPRGREKCRVLMGDFRECLMKHKQNARILIMRNERRRQYKEGERKEEFAEDVVVDAY